MPPRPTSFTSGPTALRTEATAAAVGMPQPEKLRPDRGGDALRPQLLHADPRGAAQPGDVERLHPGLGEPARHLGRDAAAGLLDQQPVARTPGASRSTAA